MPRIDRTVYDFECDFPGCPRKGQTHWANLPEGWWELRVGVWRGENDETRGIVACCPEHTRAVARTRFDEALTAMFVARGIKL